jgi:hypothetical protein
MSKRRRFNFSVEVITREVCLTWLTRPKVVKSYECKDAASGTYATYYHLCWGHRELVLGLWTEQRQDEPWLPVQPVADWRYLDEQY